MPTFTTLFTDRPHPQTGQPINGIVGVRSDRRAFTYILETSPAFRWRRFPRFQSQGAVVSVSNFAGVGHNIETALDQLKIGNAAPYRGHEPGFIRYQLLLYQRANTIIKILHEQRHLIPEMFDPELESD